jgi:antitoxin ParD1/3/4
MPTRNVNLTDRFDRFVADEIKAGRYRNASEVMRAGLRLLEQHTRAEDEKLTLLRSLAAEAFGELDQGQGIEMSGTHQLTRFVRATGRRARTGAKRASRRA